MRTADMLCINSLNIHYTLLHTYPHRRNHFDTREQLTGLACKQYSTLSVLKWFCYNGKSQKWPHSCHSFILYIKRINKNTTFSLCVCHFDRVPDSSTVSNGFNFEYMLTYWNRALWQAFILFFYLFTSVSLLLSNTGVHFPCFQCKQ